MEDRCPKCNSVHIYTKRNIEAPWDSSRNAFIDRFDRPMPRADDSAKILMECLDCDFSCLASKYPQVKAKMEKDIKADEELREKVYLKSKIKMLYEAGKKEEAEKLYLQKNSFTLSQPDIDAVYRKIIQKEQQFNFTIVFVFIALLSAFISFLASYDSIVFLISFGAIVFLFLRFIIRRILL